MHRYVLTRSQPRNQLLNRLHELPHVARRTEIGNGDREEIDSVGPTRRAFALKVKLDLFVPAEQRYDDVDTLGGQRRDVVVEPVATSRPEA